MNIKKKFYPILSAFLITVSLPLGANAAHTHKVVKGDTMWKIASKYQVGTSEIIKSNSHIQNPDLIYPGQILNIPALDNTVSQFENEVIRLVNEQRASRGLNKLSTNWELSRVARHKSLDMKNNNYFRQFYC